MKAPSLNLDKGDIMGSIGLIKHKEVVKFFLENPEKGVWSKCGLSKQWRLITNPNFNVDSIYIQNDEYIDLRKAIIDGKTIQVRTVDGKDWVDCGRHPLFSDPVREYRIKPATQEIKLGDWIYVPSGDSDGKSLVQVKIIHRGNVYEVRPLKVGSYRSWYTSTFSKKELDNGKIIVEKWKPKVKELCIFWDNVRFSLEYHIGKYGEVSSSDLLQKDFTKDNWDNVAPLDFLDNIKELV